MTLHATPPQVHDVDRLRALRSFDIIDSDPEGAFDELAELTAELCKTPVALVSLVEEDRQWFKAHTGVEMTETALDQSICIHAIASRSYLEIRDTHIDPRTRDNPICIGSKGARFYAGAPLISREGHVLGTLCVLDFRPRRLSDSQRKALRILSRQIVTQLELRQAVSVAATLRQEIDHRVKNSLQSLSSLTRVEAAMSRSAEVKSALHSLDTRINTVALVHDHLYRSGAVSTVELSGYLGNLGEYLKHIAPENVEIECQFCRVNVVSRQAAALGMLMNEVVTNSLKHGFPDGRAGKISLSTRRLRDGRVSFIGVDDGVGATAPVDGQGIGMKIAQAVSSQLGGTLELAPANPGLCVSIDFEPAD